MIDRPASLKPRTAWISAATGGRSADTSSWIEQDRTYIDRRGWPGMVALLGTWTRFGAVGPGGGITGLFGL
ncbi:hypothetical protein AB3G45_11240 [Shinella sp. S4-D37]|uniref:hypothetical protein n=1 Tax=Shinella sp. S4-D37 TaxID=3161999 RepID=UPI0034659A68